MPYQNFFYAALGVGFLILVGFISYAAYQLSLTLKELRFLIEDVDDTARDIQTIKNEIKFGFIKLFGGILKLRR